MKISVDCDMLVPSPCGQLLTTQYALTASWLSTIPALAIRRAQCWHDGATLGDREEGWEEQTSGSLSLAWTPLIASFYSIRGLLSQV